MPASATHYSADRAENTLETGKLRIDENEIVRGCCRRGCRFGGGVHTRRDSQHAGIRVDLNFYEPFFVVYRYVHCDNESRQQPCERNDFRRVRGDRRLRSYDMGGLDPADVMLTPRRSARMFGDASGMGLDGVSRFTWRTAP